MGHAMHTYYSHKNQSPMYGDYCIFVAEVASTVNEALLMQYLLKQTEDPMEKQYLLNYFMDQFKSTLYRQTMFAKFELNMHLAYQQGETYIRFLSGGSSADPIDLLKIAGVDMSTQKTIEEALDLFNRLITQFKEIQE